jgi:hypothetical protein
MIDTINTLLNSDIGEHVVVQTHPLPGSIRIKIGQMSYKER